MHPRDQQRGIFRKRKRFDEGLDSYGQTNLGTATVVDLRATKKLKAADLTTTERNALTNVGAGTFCYNTTDSEFQGYDGSTWSALGGGGGGGATTFALADNISGTVGTGNDLTIVHNGTDTSFTSATGNLLFNNTAATSNTQFQLGTSDTATKFEILNSGSTSIFEVDGFGGTTLKGDLYMGSGNTVNMGPANDCYMYHNGTQAYIKSTTGGFTMDHTGTGGLGDLTFNNSAGDTIFDNKYPTGATKIILGTDNADTKFEVLNDSLSPLFSVDGAGTFTGLPAILPSTTFGTDSIAINCTVPGSGTGISNLLLGSAPASRVGGDLTSGNYNVLIGDDLGDYITSGSSNTGVGYGVFGYASALTGSNNTGMGYLACGNIKGAADKNCGFGLEALRGSSAGCTGLGNVGAGYRAGLEVTYGSWNAFYGAQAGEENTSGGYNVAVGASALRKNTKSSFNVGAGYLAGGCHSSEANPGSYNCSVGRYTLYEYTTGAYNSAFGDSAGYGNITTQDRTLSLGASAGDTLTRTDRDVVIAGGNSADYQLIHASCDNTSRHWSPAVDNTADLGTSSRGWKDLHLRNDLFIADNGLLTLGTGNDFTVTHDGTDTTFDNTHTSGDTIFKLGSLSSGTQFQIQNSSGGNLFRVNAINLGAGLGSLADISSGTENIAFGIDAATHLTSGVQNIAMGVEALNSISATALTGSRNVAIGPYACTWFLGSAYHNIGIGRYALAGAGTGMTAYENCVVGDAAGYTVSTGFRNTLIGTRAGNDVTSGGYNTYVGREAGNDATTGSNNAAVGAASLNSLTTGKENSGMGPRSLWNITTQDYTVGLGNYSGHTLPANDYGLYIGCDNHIDYQLIYGLMDGTGTRHFGPAVDNVINLGNGSYRWAQLFAGTATIDTSDSNLKKNITYLEKNEALDLLKLLKPCTYQFNDKEAGRTHYGLIAQDVKKMMDEKNISAHDFAPYCEDIIEETEVVDRVDKEGNLVYSGNGKEDPDYDEKNPPKVIQDCKPTGKSHIRRGLRYTEFIGILISAVQALETRVAQLESV